jgi:hypothetical protein
MFSWLHFLSPKAKISHKGKRCQDVESIKENMTVELNAAPLEAFVDCFQKLFNQFKKCIQVGEGCFEQKYNNALDISNF